MIYNELPISFPWYDDKQKQNRFRENMEGMDEWGLIAPSDALLPFQIRQIFTVPSTTIATWKIFTTGDVLAATISDLSPIRYALKEGNHYFYYAGETLATAGGPLSLAPGFYYSEIHLASGGPFFYSEVFHVPACSFLAASAPASVEFLKLVWYNDTDIRPIFYNSFDGLGVPYFRNVLYLDSFVHDADPEMVEEALPDGDGRAIPTFQRVILRYRLTDLVPAFLKTALVTMQMHDHIFLTTRRGLRNGEVEKITVSVSPEFGGAFTTVEILVEEILALIKKGCGDNMP